VLVEVRPVVVSLVFGDVGHVVTPGPGDVGHVVVPGHVAGELGDGRGGDSPRRRDVYHPVRGLVEVDRGNRELLVVLPDTTDLGLGTLPHGRQLEVGAIALRYNLRLADAT